MTPERAVGSATTSELEPIAPRAWAVLSVCSATVVLTLLDSGALFVSFPFIEERFATTASRATVSWVVTAFFIVMVSSLLVAGRLADRFGRREVFLTGLLLYGGAALVAGGATNVYVLIGARAVQGAGVALLAPASVALSLPEFPPSRRAYALGVWGTIGAAAGLVAAPLGAVLVQLFDWRAVFLFNGALALAVFVVGLRVLDDDVARGDDGPIDVFSAVLATGAVAGLTLVLVQGNDWGWSSGPILAAAVATVVSAALFVRQNARSEAPLIDSSVFTDRRFAVASTASVCCQLGFFSIYFGVPLYMEEVWEWGPIRIGLGLLPLSAVPVLTAAAAGRMVDRRGPREMIGYGGVFSAAVFLALGLWLTDAGYFWMAVGMGLASLGTMAIGNHTTVAALAGVDDKKLGSANAGYFMTRRLGSALGAVAVAAIVGNREGAAFADIYIWVWVFGAAAYLIGGLVTLRWYPTRPVSHPGT